jgi:hypothetical protein
MCSSVAPRREVAAVVALQQVVLCLASDPASLEVHGGSVLHQDPALLPKVLLRQMQQDAIEDGGPDASIDEYVTFCFLFAHEDRADLYIGGDPTCVRKQIDGFPTLAAACGFAQEWVGSSATERDFHHMPGIYKTAFVKFTNGYQADLDPLEMAGTSRHPRKRTSCSCVTFRRDSSRPRSPQIPAGCLGA